MKRKNKIIMKNKKAQMKIQEMLFMLLAVFFFFVLVGMFLFSIMYSSIYKEATRIAESRTLSSIINLADSPEFSCGEPNCVDGDKLMALVKYESANNNYIEFWPFSRLEVLKSSGFYKNESDIIICTSANYPNCDRFIVYDKEVENERAVRSYVALCRKESEAGYIYNKCEIARFIAGTEIKSA